MTTPAVTPDPLDDIEPTDEEIAAAARDEQRDATARTRQLRDAAKKTAPAKRSPGRPKGSKTRSKPERDARAAGASSAVSSKTPRGLSGAAANAHKAATDAKREERAATVRALSDEAMSRRPQLVGAIGLATGIPRQFLIQHDEQGREVRQLVEGEPVGPSILTHYGEALAPQEWQVKAVVEGGVRLMESEQGEKLIEMWERFAPYFYGTAAIGALALYTVTALQATKAIKPMIEIELQQMQAAAQNAQQGGDGTSGGSAGQPG